MKHPMRSLLQAVSLIAVLAAFIMTGCQPKPDPAITLQPPLDKYVDIWNGADAKGLESILDAHFVRHSNLLPDVEGIEGMKKVIAGFRTAYPDVKITLNDRLFSENKSAARWTFTGTNTGPGEMAPTGKAVKVWGTSIIHFANGKMTEEWVAFDNHAFMEQLGLVMTPPAPAKK